MIGPKNEGGRLPHGSAAEPVVPHSRRQCRTLGPRRELPAFRPSNDGFLPASAQITPPSQPFSAVYFAHVKTNLRLPKTKLLFTKSLADNQMVFRR